MTFKYQQPPASELRQGEILAGIWHITAEHPASEPSGPVTFKYARHDRVIVLTSDCDLLRDHDARKAETPNQRDLLWQVLLCEMYSKEQIRELHDINAKRFESVRTNQVDRLHYLHPAEIDVSGGICPESILDFRRNFGIDPASIYAAIQEDTITRLARLNGDCLHDLMHRFYSYLSRVAVDVEFGGGEGS